MIHAIYEFTELCGIKPYVGFGLGYQKRQLKIHTIVSPFFDRYGYIYSSKTGFAMDALAGISYSITKNVDVDLQYRIFADNQKTRAKHKCIGVGLRYFF